MVACATCLVSSAFFIFSAGESIRARGLLGIIFSLLETQPCASGHASADFANFSVTFLVPVNHNEQGDVFVPEPVLKRKP
jgi:hypothetical protein